MVGFKRLFCFKYVLAAALLFVPALYANSALELGWMCIIGKTRCCLNGVKSCCEDNGMIYDTSCGGICSAGARENNYTASGCSYTTKTRTCCSDGTWSAWDVACPVNKTCPTASKPSTSTTCYGGKKYRTVTCNKSTGTWESGDWGDCDCSESGFKTVLLSGGGKCCEMIDGTGLKCWSDQEIVGHQWVRMGIHYDCTGRCPAGTPSAGASCPESWAGIFCTVHHSWTIRGEEVCEEFYCR